MNPLSFKKGTVLAPRSAWVQILIVVIGLPSLAWAEATTNAFSGPLAAPSLPDTGPSLLRVIRELSNSLGLFLAGAWFVRNGRLSNLGRPRSARLNVLETRSLGARQSLLVVAYGTERFLIGSTPAGINLLSHLAPSAESEADPSAPPAANPSFTQALSQVLRGAKSGPGNPGGQKP